MATTYVSCDKCMIKLNYYDYLSHSELCNYGSERHSHELNDDMQTHYDQSDFATYYDYDVANDYDADVEDSGTEEVITTISNTISNDALLDASRHIFRNNSLYNPMLNRGFYNESEYNEINTYNNTDENLLSLLTNQLLTLNMNNNAGLGSDNLDLYSTLIPINTESYCVICMNTYDIGNNFYLMKCMHAFCIDCTKLWFDIKSLCPLCNTNLKTL